MAIRVNHDPSAATVVPAAYSAGLGQYRQRQNEIGRDQFNRDRAAAMQANEQQQRMQLAQQQQAAQQDQMYLQAAMRNQENQQQAALAQQQLGQRQQQFEQANAVDQQQVVQKGLQEGTLRYTAAQKQQMNKLYGDWDRVNQAKNLNPRDRELAQQELRRQLQTIQPRPVTEDERPISIKDAIANETYEDPRFPGTLLGRQKDGKIYAVSMIPRGSKAGGEKTEVPSGQPFYLPDDNPLGKADGEPAIPLKIKTPDGWVDNPNHPWNKKADTTAKKPDLAAEYKEMIEHAKDLYKINKDEGMTYPEAKAQAAKDFAERRAAIDPSSQTATPSSGGDEPGFFERKQAIPKQYAELHKQVSAMQLPLGVSAEDVLPPPHKATPREMEAALRQYGPQQPSQSQQQPPQQQLPPLTPEEAASYADALSAPQQQPPAQQTEKTRATQIEDGGVYYDDAGETLTMRKNTDGTFTGHGKNGFVARYSATGEILDDAAQPVPQPQQQPPARPTESLQTGLTVLRDDMNRRGHKPQNEADIVKHYTGSGDTVPEDAVRSLSRYIKQKYGNNIESITPEDAQLMTILAAAAKQADAEAKRNSPQKTTKLP